MIDRPVICCAPDIARQMSRRNEWTADTSADRRPLTCPNMAGDPARCLVEDGLGKNNIDEDNSVALIEHETKETLSREQAAQRLHEIADELARHNEISFVKEGQTTRIDVPDEVTLEVEIEVGETSEIEIEISW